MDSGTISQLVFLFFGVTVFIYGFVLYKDLAQLRAANDTALTRLNSLVRVLRELPISGSTEKQARGEELQQRISTQAESLNNAVRQYNARIGQFPEAIVAAIMGLQRRQLFSENVAPSDNEHCHGS